MEHKAELLARIAELKAEANRLREKFNVISTLLERENVKSFLQSESTEFLNYILYSIGEEKENYELCQIIKEILVARNQIKKAR